MDLLLILVCSECNLHTYRQLRRHFNVSDFAPERVAQDYKKFLAGQAGNLLQRLQSKVMLGKMTSSIAAVESITTTKDEEVIDLSEYVKSLPSETVP